jgi:cytidine deaminase
MANNSNRNNDDNSSLNRIHPSQYVVSDIDHTYLNLCFQYKSQLAKGPLHTNFKVYAIISFIMPDEVAAHNQHSNIVDDVHSSLNDLDSNDLDSEAVKLYYSNGYNLHRQHPTNDNFSAFCGINPFSLSHHKYNGKQVYYLTGTNVELCFTGLGICAERAALSQLRQINYEKVLSVYIVSDLNSELTPGMLCREFLHNFIHRTTPIIMASKDIPTASNYSTRVTNLTQLFVEPCLFMHVSAPFLDNWAKQFLQTAHKFSDHLKTQQSASDSHLIQLNEMYSKCVQYTAYDNTDTINGIRLAAAVLFADNTIHYAHQTKLLEYGYSLSPISKLIGVMEDKFRQNQSKPMLLLHTDKYGILHSPFACDRAHLTENPLFKQCRTIIHTSNGQLINLAMSEFVIDSPDLITALANQATVFQQEKQHIMQAEQSLHRHKA